MTISDLTRDEATGSWVALLGGRHLRAMIVLAGGVGPYATNVYVTISLLSW